MGKRTGKIALTTSSNDIVWEPTTPMPPIEIAKAALFLVSEDASYVSGAILTVDGGASLM